MTFIQHQKSLSGQKTLFPITFLAHRVLLSKTRCGFACRFTLCKAMGWDLTYKKYDFLYYQIPTQGRRPNSKIFSQGHPFYSLKPFLTPSKHPLFSGMGKQGPRSSFVYTKRECSLDGEIIKHSGDGQAGSSARVFRKNRGAAAFFKREKRRVLRHTYASLFPRINKASYGKEMLNSCISSLRVFSVLKKHGRIPFLFLQKRNANRTITIAKLKSFQYSIKNPYRDGVFNISKHGHIYGLNRLKLLQGQCSQTQKMYFSPRYQVKWGGFFFSSNSLRIQNPFAFYSYDQKWNQRFSITIQTFRIFINETGFPGGAFNILAKRQRFITNSLKGILLVNFPEKEKNFLIKNLAAENKIALITQSASLLLKDSRNMDDLLGVDDPIQILFDKVKTCIPCICFINNLDRIGKQRYEQKHKSLHGLNNSISLSLDQHFTSDSIFNTRNTKQNHRVEDFLTRVSYNKKSGFPAGPLNTKAVPNKQFGLNKTFGLNHDVKNVQNNNPNAWQILKYLTVFNPSPNKNKFEPIRPFFNLLFKLSIGSKDFIYTNSNKQSFLQFSIKKNLSYLSPCGNYTLPLQGFYKLMCYRYFVNKRSYIQYKDNMLNEKYNTYPKDGAFEPWPLIFKYSSFIQNIIWDKKPDYIFKKKPIFFSNPFYQGRKRDKASFRWLRDAFPFQKKQDLSVEFFEKTLSEDLTAAFSRGEKRWVLVNRGLKKKFLAASEIPSRTCGDFLLTKRKKHLSDRVLKAPPRNYHRLPYWLFKNSSFFQYKITIGKVKLLNTPPENWFYDKKRKEENILTSLKARVNPLLLQMAFCQSHSNITNPIFAKIESNMVDPQRNLENLSTISKIPLLQNSPQGRIKSNSTKIDATFLKSISKRNMYDIASRQGFSSKKKHGFLPPIGFKDLGKINTNQKQKIPARAEIFIDSNMQNFNSKASVFSKNHRFAEKTNRSVFNDMPVNTEFKESISYDSLSSTKQEDDKNNSFKITETEIIKRTALLKFLQILDGFHTTRVYKYKQTWPKLLKSINGFGLTKNFLSNDAGQNENSSSKLETRNKSFFSIQGVADFLTPLKETKKLKKRDNIGNIDLTQNASRRQFLEINISPLRIGASEKLKLVKKSSINNTMIVFKPSVDTDRRTSLYQKICPKNNSLNDALQKKTFRYLRVASKIPKWEVYLKNQPSGKSLNLLCVWPSYIDDIMGPLNINDSASYLLPEYFQLLGHGPKLKKQGITLIASTNNLATLDAALLRPGRFDTIINFSHRLSSIYKSSKILKHSPSLIQNKIFSLSVSIPINTLASSVSSWSFVNISKTIQNQFYPQVTVLDIPSQSISIKTFIDVSVFIHYKLWWSFNNEKLPSATGFHPKNDISYFEKSFDATFKSNISVVILILKFPIQKIKHVTSSFISILRMISFQFFGGAFYNFLKYFMTFKEKLVGARYENLLFRLSEIQRLQFPFISTWVVADFPRRGENSKDKEKLKLALSEDFDINETKFTTEQFIINKNSNQKEGTSFINAFSREVLTSRIVNLGLAHRVADFSTLHGALDPNYISSNEAWTTPNYKTMSTDGKAQHSISAYTESCNFQMKDSDIFLKANRRLLFCKGDFDYKTYLKNNSEILLVKTNPNDLKPPRGGSATFNHLSSQGIFVDSIGVKTAFLDQSSKIWKYNGKAIVSKNVNMNNALLTKYNEIYKLKKIKLKKQSFFNLHPFTRFMLKRWSRVTKSNKLKRHLKISLVKTHLPWKNEIYNTNDFDFSKLSNMKANLHNHNLEYDHNRPSRDFQLYNENKMTFSASSVYFNKQRTRPPGRQVRQGDAQNSWSSNSDIMSLSNKIYHNIYSKILLIPIPLSLLKSQSLKTFATNSFSTYECYLFRKLRKNFSLNIIGLQIDSILTLQLQQLLKGEITDLKRGKGNDFFKDLRMSSRADNYQTSLTCKNKISNVHLLEKENPATRWKKIPRKSVINYTRNDFQTECKFKYHCLASRVYLDKHETRPPCGQIRMRDAKNNESKIDNNIILLKNFASNKKKEHDFRKTHESFFQKAPLEKYWPSSNKLNGDPPEMCRLDTSFFILIFYTMFFEKIQHKKITLNTIKIFMPYRSLIFSHFLLSKADSYGFYSKNFEILIYNKFKNFLDL